jgi:hypothetical protein
MSEWDRLPRFSKLASCLWPDRVEPTRRAEMNKLAAGEKKTLRDPALLSDEARKHVSPLGGEAVGWGRLKQRR